MLLSLPIVIQSFFFDAISQFNLGRVFEEKLNELQGPSIVEEDDFWADNLIGFHKLQGYNFDAGKGADRIITSDGIPLGFSEALNNSMQGYLVKDNLPDNLKGRASSWLNPKEVSGWELRDGSLSSAIDEKNKTIQDEDGLIRGNYFDRIMHNIMSDFTNYSAYYE